MYSYVDSSNEGGYGTAFSSSNRKGSIIPNFLNNFGQTITSGITNAVNGVKNFFANNRPYDLNDWKNLLSGSNSDVNTSPTSGFSASIPSGFSNGSMFDVSSASEYDNSTAKLQAWYEKMSNTAIQRQVADMREAGINPILAGSYGGASVANVSGQDQTMDIAKLQAQTSLAVAAINAQSAVNVAKINNSVGFNVKTFGDVVKLVSALR